MDREEAQQVFDGVMLSDGGLYRPSTACDAYFYIRQSGREHLDWEYYICDALAVLGVEVSLLYPKVTKRVSRWGKLRDECDLVSLSHPLLTLQYLRWYGNGRKEVPGDFMFTPVSLANELAGDGSTHRKATLSAHVELFLHTQSFSFRSIKTLEQALHGIGLVTSRAPVKLKGLGSGVRILVLQESVDKFMDIVEPYVVPSYRYKIKRNAG